MRIGVPRIVERDGGVEYRVDVEASAGPRELWFRVDASHGDLVSARADAALLGLLLPAMRAGEDVDVQGEVSERLLYNLSESFQFVMRFVIPELREVAIRAASGGVAPNRARGVATGFSAGIDSFWVVAEHHYGEPVPGHRLTHLLYNNVGSHGPEGNPLFRRRHARLRPVAERIGLPFVAVDSNLMSFYRSDVSFKHTYTVRNVVVALLLQAGIGRSFHAAGTVLDGTPPSLPLKDIAHFDPVILPMMSTEALDAVWAGGTVTRVEKTLQVAEIADSWDTLDVCVRNDRAGNCSTCKKCVRTLLTLEIAGLTERYAGVFDVDLFRRQRHWRVGRILRSNWANSHEIRELARERGYRFGLRERLIGILGLDGARDWLIGRVARTESGGRRIRERKLHRPGATSKSLPADGSTRDTSSAA